MFNNYFYKFHTLLVILIITFLPGYNQDIHYSNNHENFFNLNPAGINNVENAALNLNYRNQWPGSADFVNYTAAFFNTFKKLKSTMGLQIMRDDQGKGIITNTGFSLLYGYQTKLINNIILSAGLSGSYYIYSVNSHQLNFENNQVPLSVENQKKQFLDFSAGFEFNFYKKNRIGAAISHISSPKISSENNLSKKITINYHGYYNLGSYYSPRKLYLEPLIISSFQDASGEFIYGSRINVEGILGGLYLRNDNNFKFDALIILLGINFGKITLNYTYDINLSGSQSRFNKLASHEVTFFYNLEYNIRRNKKGAIKCPKI